MGAEKTASGAFTEDVHRLLKSGEICARVRTGVVTLYTGKTGDREFRDVDSLRNLAAMINRCADLLEGK